MTQGMAPAVMVILLRFWHWV